MTDDVHRPNDEPAKHVTRIWSDTVRIDRCKSRRCAKPVWWAMNVRTGRWMIFDGAPRYEFASEEVDTGRVMWTVSLALTHWDKCVDADRFRQSRSSRSRSSR